MRSVILAAFLAVLPAAALAASPPAAIFTDPAPDAAHPARLASVRVPSHGALMNAVWYVPTGAGPHPTVLLLHGLPGNERNFDLAQAIRRAGWNVLVVHYRGAWGSGGAFSLANAREDVDAALVYVRSADAAKVAAVDARRIVVIGHSMGGYLAVDPAAKDGGVAGIGLLAPWNIGADSAGVPPAGEARAAWAPKAFDDVDGRLAGATPLSLANEVAAHADWNLRNPAYAITGKRLLVISTDDGAKAQADAIAALASASGNRDVVNLHMTTDHSFNDHRIAMQTAVLKWLASFPSR